MNHFLKAYSYHVLSDALSLFVGLISFLAHQRPAADDEDEEDDLPTTNTYGWVRIELVGSLISHVSIISLCFRLVLGRDDKFRVLLYRRNEIIR